MRLVAVVGTIAALLAAVAVGAGAGWSLALAVGLVGLAAVLAMTLGRVRRLRRHLAAARADLVRSGRLDP
jgi:hypothetical protein